MNYSWAFNELGGEAVLIRKSCVRESERFDKTKKIKHGSKVNYVKIFLVLKYVSRQTPPSKFLNKTK